MLLFVGVSAATYVKVYVLENGMCLAKKKTKVVKRNLDPTYQQALLFDESPQGKVLQVCWHFFFSAFFVTVIIVRSDGVKDFFFFFWYIHIFFFSKTLYLVPCLDLLFLGICETHKTELEASRIT